jgi:hypothetical protein
MTKNDIEIKHNFTCLSTATTQYKLFLQFDSRTASYNLYLALTNIHRTNYRLARIIKSETIEEIKKGYN